MAKEIERKFLVISDEWRNEDTADRIRQGYLNLDKDRTVRVRVTNDDRAILTIKGRSRGLVRDEFEYPVRLPDANHMLDVLCIQPLIEKRRHHATFARLTWEVDEFRGANEGLVIAEVELDSPDQQIELPPWASREVTDDPRYFNANLVTYPYEQWSEAER